MKKQQQRVEADLCHAQNRISLPRLQAFTKLPLTGFNGALQSAGKVFATGTVLCASLATLPAFAGTLYSQPPSTFLSTMLSQADTAFSDGSAWVNDDFIASQSGAITHISWQGDAQPAGNTGFTITFIPAVVAGNPYTPTLPELATVAPLMTVTVPGNAGQTLNTGTLYNFNAVLPTPFNLVKGIRYWINIESTGINPWGWANGTGGNASINYCQQTPYVCTLGVSDRAFSLNDTTVTASLVSGEVNVAYPATALAGTVSGNSLLDATTVPPGMTVNQGTAPFTLSGTPTQTGNYTFTVIGNATDDIFNITIATPVALATTTLANGTEGTAYSAAVFATGGSTPYNWSVSGLPTGLTYAVSTDTKTVTLSGTPAAVTAGLYNVAFTVTDAAGGAILPTPILGLTIGAAQTPPVVIATTTLPSGTEGVAYPGAILSATGGKAPYTWAITGGTLPAGMNFTNATLAGTPAVGSAAVSPVSLTFTVTDSLGAKTQQSLSLTLAAAPVAVIPVAISTTSLTATENVYSSTTLMATGGTAPYTWTVSSVLPANLTLSPNGVLSGTPAIGTAGKYNLTFTATDNKGAVGTKALILTIAAAPAPVTPPTTPGGSNSKLCTLVNNAQNKLPLVNGSDKITAVGKGYIKVGTTKLYHSSCTTDNFIAPATKFVVGETATWTGHLILGFTEAASITVSK